MAGITSRSSADWIEISSERLPSPSRGQYCERPDTGVRLQLQYGLSIGIAAVSRVLQRAQLEVVRGRRAAQGAALHRAIVWDGRIDHAVESRTWSCARGPNNMDYSPPRWPYSPRIVMTPHG